VTGDASRRKKLGAIGNLGSHPKKAVKDADAQKTDLRLRLVAVVPMLAGAARTTGIELSIGELVSMAGG
jgi:hypothetical protein